MSTALLEPELAPVEPSKAPRNRFRVIAFVLALGLVGGTAAYSAVSSTTTPSASSVTPEVLADRYGAKVDLVAVAALGGMVQLRFTVLDVKKADVLFHDQDKMPRLHVEGTDITLNPPSGMKHSMKMVAGGSYSILYGNRANKVHDGSKISVIIGDIQLQHQVARA